MDFTYDKVADALYIYISRGEIKESKQITETVLIDYNIDDEIYGIEILNFSNSQVNLNDLLKLSDNEIIANVTAL